MRPDPIDDQSRSDDTRDGGKNPRWGQERRMQFIDFRLQWEGRINRSDLMKFFGTSTPQASADLSLYQDLFPGNTRYSASDKHYVALATFRPGFPSSGPRQYLAQLLALNRGVVKPDETFLGTNPPLAAVPVPTRTVDEGTLKAIVRAIAEGGTLELDYQSLTRREPTTRSISPHAFGHDGKRFHVRAYCHLRSKFRDFVIGRILRVGPSTLAPISSADDVEWHTELTLVLKPHPALTKDQRRGIEVDYGMEGGQVVMACRHAILYYALQSLNLGFDGGPRKGYEEVIIANLADITDYLPTVSPRT